MFNWPMTIEDREMSSWAGDVAPQQSMPSVCNGPRAAFPEPGKKKKKCQIVKYARFAN